MNVASNLRRGTTKRSAAAAAGRIRIPVVKVFGFLVAFFIGMMVQNVLHILSQGGSQLPENSLVKSQSQSTMTNIDDEYLEKLPSAFHGMIRRAKTHQKHCKALHLLDQNAIPTNSDHEIHLPQFGLLDFLEHRYEDHLNNYPYQCVIPPENECEETQFTVVFMAYNPDRLEKLYNQAFKMTSNAEFEPLVREIVVVWNGERNIEETKLGQALVDLGKTKPVRISYPLKAGFPNDLFNRYHPRLEIKTKAIMYYDDDGPFYSAKATLGGFELWKRNSDAQIGAMARKLDLNDRQKDEKSAILNGVGDRFFVSQCPTDQLRYNYNEFANFGANMVLPSGSFLHRNYLACLWHPLFEEIRDYVRKHPVNPDDGTTSVIVSHLSGRAPKVYSRRINESKDQGRKLLEVLPSMDEDTGEALLTMDLESQTEEERLYHRRLMDGINWDAGGNHEKKMDWGKLRSDAANSLIRYFGSVNSGSIGWCYGTKFQEGEYCKPEMARLGKLPWLKPDHTPRDSCP